MEHFILLSDVLIILSISALKSSLISHDFQYFRFFFFELLTHIAPRCFIEVSIRIYDIEKVEESNQSSQRNLLFLISRGQLPGVQKFKIHCLPFFLNAFLLKIYVLCISFREYFCKLNKL